MGCVGIAGHVVKGMVSGLNCYATALGSLVNRDIDRHTAGCIHGGS